MQIVTEVTGPNGEVAKIEVDGFGRPTRVFGPSAETIGQTASVPNRIVELELPDVTGKPITRVHTRQLDGDNENDAKYHESYKYMDGLGRTILALSEADPDPTSGDGFAWVASGLSEYDKKGAVRRKYLPWSLSAAPTGFDFALPANARYSEQLSDAFGRPIQSIGLDGLVSSKVRYHALSADMWDAEDLTAGTHQGTYSTQEKDGHGRAVRSTERVRVAGKLEERYVIPSYLSTGEVTSITRQRGTDSVVRTMKYDSLGRMVENYDPNTSTNGKPWRYVYSDAGELVATSDARGCGSNFSYDTGGRLVAEDYSPCEFPAQGDPAWKQYHEAYDHEPEVTYLYDVPDPDSPFAFPGKPQTYTRGQLTSVRDRASKVLTRWDSARRVRQVAKQVAAPDGSYSFEQWFRRSIDYDGAGRPVSETTGASVNTSSEDQSAVLTSYSSRGGAKQIGSTYGALIRRMKENAEGLAEEIEFADGGKTTIGYSYDDLRRPSSITTYRANPQWGVNPNSGDEQFSKQRLLSDEEYVYDRANNPVEIRDWRLENEWPAGAKPVTKKMKYDDLYRLIRTDYEYPGGADSWRDPFAAEAQSQPSTDKAEPSPRADFAGQGRPLTQSWSYDWLGNSISSDDDSHAFYDRSLGTVVNDVYRIRAASNSSMTGNRTGNLSADYDAAGYLKSLTIHRGGPCVPAGKCNDQHFEYSWDEVGRVASARRWDKADWQGSLPNVELRYVYDCSDNRVRKTVHLPDGDERHTLYIFSSLELRLASFDSSTKTYEVSSRTEVPYLVAGGKKLARVVYTEAPDSTTNRRFPSADGRIVARDRTRPLDDGKRRVELSRGQTGRELAKEER